MEAVDPEDDNDDDSTDEDGNDNNNYDELSQVSEGTVSVHGSVDNVHGSDVQYVGSTNEQGETDFDIQVARLSNPSGTHEVYTYGRSKRKRLKGKKDKVKKNKKHHPNIPTKTKFFLHLMLRYHQKQIW